MYDSGGAIDNGGGCACIGAGSIWDFWVPSAQFYYEAKTALKQSLLRIKKTNH